VTEALDHRPLVAASFLHVVRPDSSAIEPGYLLWWFNHPQAQQQLANEAHGTKIPFLSLKSARSLRIPVPPVTVQRQIAELHNLAERESQIMGDLRRLRLKLNHALIRHIATGVDYA
jgi:hypothetical protein